MIDQISEWLDQGVELLNKINSLPALGIVIASSWMLGFALKRSKRIHNSAIPMVIIFWGAAINPFLSDFQNSTWPFRIWLARNIVVGAIVSLLGWVSHRIIWKCAIAPKLQVWFPTVAKALDNSNDTDRFRKEDVQPVEPIKPIEPTETPKTQ